MSAGGAKLQPIAALCAVLLFVWGGVAIASVIAQIEINQKRGLWPSTLDSWAAWSILLSFAAAVVGVPAVVCGIVGLRRRAALHVGGLLVLASAACTLVARTIDNVKFDRPWFGGDQSMWQDYRWGLTWHAIPPELGYQRWWFFAVHLLLPLAVVVLLAWIAVLATGAGRRAAGSGLGYAYVAAPQADYRYVVTPDAVVAEEAEPRDAPSPAGVVPEFAPAEVMAAESEAPERTERSEEPEQSEQSAPDDDDADDDADDVPDVESVRAAAEDRPAGDARVWFVTVQGADHGPYSRTQLQSYVDEGRLHAGTRTHLAGGAVRPLSEVL